MALGRRFKIILGTLGALIVLGGSLFIYSWWFYAYSRGSRTGIIRKISVKGPPYCKYLAGEMSITGTAPGQPAEIWEFTVEDDRATNPLVQNLHVAEREGKAVTLDYRQDLHTWYRCRPGEYFVIGVEKQ